MAPKLTASKSQSYKMSNLPVTSGGSGSSGAAQPTGPVSKRQAKKQAKQQAANKMPTRDEAAVGATNAIDQYKEIQKELPPIFSTPSDKDRDIKLAERRHPGHHGVILGDAPGPMARTLAHILSPAGVMLGPAMISVASKHNPPNKGSIILAGTAVTSIPLLSNRMSPA